MKLIAITCENEVTDEAELISRMLDSGFYRVHIRKPMWSEQQLRLLIESIPSSYYPNLSLHDFHNLAIEYRLGGIHLNRRNPIAPTDFAGVVSSSCHSINEVSESSCDYTFISPIFDSISKSNYQSRFRRKDLEDALSQQWIDKEVYALGGISYSNIDLVRDIGFRGAALLGDIWLHKSTAEIIEHIKLLSKWTNSNT